MSWWFSAVLALLLALVADAGFRCHNSCGGHGRCSNDDVCHCEAAWQGGASDCSLRSCPVGHAWADKAVDLDTAHSLAECSRAGLCNRDTGVCECFGGFEGAACDRMSCSGDPLCGGHGACRTIGSVYSAYNVRNNVSAVYTNWDRGATTTCVCDPGYTGGRCELRMCPKGGDPMIYNNGFFQIKLRTYAPRGSNMGGMFKFVFQGQSFKFPANVPSWNMTACKRAFESLPNIATANCSQNGTDWYGGGTAYTVDLTFPYVVYENNLWSHNGMPALTDFVCDTSLTTSNWPGMACTIMAGSHSIVPPTYEYCSNRGICDFDSGVCSCYPQFSGPACDNYAASPVLGTPADILTVTTARPSFAANVLHLASTVRGDPSWGSIVGGNSSTPLFEMDGYGSVQLNYGGLNVMGTGSGTSPTPAGVFINTLGVTVTGGVTVNSVGINLAAPLNITLRDGGASVYGGLTVKTGGMTVSTLGLNVLATGMTVSDFGVDLVTGDLSVNAGGMTITRGDVLVYGAMTVNAGGLFVNTHNKGFTIQNNGLNITAGGLKVSNLGVDVRSGGSSLSTDGLVQVNSGDVNLAATAAFDTSIYTTYCPSPTPSCDNSKPSAIISVGGLSVDTGTVTISKSGLAIMGGVTADKGTAASALVISAGGLNVSASGLSVSGGVSVSDGLSPKNMKVDGIFNVTSGGIVMSTGSSGITVYSGGVTVNGVSTNGNNIYFASGIGLTLTEFTSSGAIAVTGGMSVKNLGMSVIGGLEIVDVGLVVDFNSTTITAVDIADLGVSVDGTTFGVNVLNSGFAATGGVTVGNTGLTVTSGGIVVSGGLIADSATVSYPTSPPVTMRVNGDATANTLIVTGGSIEVTYGSVSVTGGVTIESGGLQDLRTQWTTENRWWDSKDPVGIYDTGLFVNSNMTINSGGLYVSTNATVAGGITVSVTGLSVTSGGLHFSSGSTSFNMLTVSGGISVSTVGLKLNDSLTVVDTGLSISDSLRVAGGLVVASGSRRLDETEVESLGEGEAEGRRLLESGSGEDVSRQLLDAPSPEPTVIPTPVPSAVPTPAPTAPVLLMTVKGGAVVNDVGIVTDQFTYATTAAFFAKDPTETTIVKDGGLVTTQLSIDGDGMTYGGKFTGTSSTTTLNVQSTLFGRLDDGMRISYGGNIVTLSSCSLLAVISGGTGGVSSTTLTVQSTTSGTVTVGQTMTYAGMRANLTGCSMSNGAGTCTMVGYASIPTDTSILTDNGMSRIQASASGSFLNISALTSGPEVGDGTVITYESTTFTLTGCQLIVSTGYCKLGIAMSIPSGTKLAPYGAGTCTMSSSLSIPSGTSLSIYNSTSDQFSVTSGASVSGGMTVKNYGLYVPLSLGISDGLSSSGKVSVKDNGLYVALSGVSADIMTVAGGVTIASGGVTAHSLAVRKSGLSLTGGLTASSINVTAATAAFTKNSVTISGGAVTGATGLIIAGLDYFSFVTGTDIPDLTYVAGFSDNTAWITSPISIASTTVTYTKPTLLVQDTGMTVTVTTGAATAVRASTIRTDEVSITGGDAYVGGGISVVDTGVTINNGLAVHDTGVQVSGGMTYVGTTGEVLGTTGVSVASTFNVTSGGMLVYDGFSVEDSGAHVLTGGLNVGGSSANGGGLTCLGSCNNCFSDRRLKTNITTLPGCLEKLAALQPVYYSWDKQQIAELGQDPDLTRFDGARHVGFLAQEAAAVLPESVREVSGGFFGVTYSAFTPVLVEALREIDARLGRAGGAAGAGARSKKAAKAARERRLRDAVRELGLAVERAEQAEAAAAS